MQFVQFNEAAGQWLNHAHLILQDAAQVLFEQKLECPLEEPICSHGPEQ